MTCSNRFKPVSVCSPAQKQLSSKSQVVLSSRRHQSVCVQITNQNSHFRTTFNVCLMLCATCFSVLLFAFNNHFNLSEVFLSTLKSPLYIKCIIIFIKHIFLLCRQTPSSLPCLRFSFSFIHYNISRRFQWNFFLLFQRKQPTWCCVNNPDYRGADSERRCCWILSLSVWINDLLFIEFIEYKVFYSLYVSSETVTHSGVVCSFFSCLFPPCLEWLRLPQCHSRCLSAESVQGLQQHEAIVYVNHHH